MNEFFVKTPEQLGAILRGYRQQKGWTQKETGTKIGLAQNAISGIEAEPAKAGLARIFKVLSALELDLVVRPKGKAGKGHAW